MKKIKIEYKFFMVGFNLVRAIESDIIFHDLTKNNNKTNLNLINSTLQNNFF